METYPRRLYAEETGRTREAQGKPDGYIEDLERLGPEGNDPHARKLSLRTP